MVPSCVSVIQVCKTLCITFRRQSRRYAAQNCSFDVDQRACKQEVHSRHIFSYFKKMLYPACHPTACSIILAFTSITALQKEGKPQQVRIYVPTTYHGEPVAYKTYYKLHPLRTSQPPALDHVLPTKSRPRTHKQTH